MAEKEINEISADMRRIYNKAVEAAQRENFDYAIALFNQVLEKEPALFECRKAWSTSTNAVIASIIGTARGSTQGSWRPRPLSVVF